MLQNTDLEQWTSVVLADAAAVAAALVGDAGAPIDPRGVVANGEDGRGRVEVGHLGGQQLADRVEDEPPNAEQVNAVAALQDAGDLLHLVALDVDAPQDGERAELVFAGALQLVLSAQHGLVLEEHAARPDGAGEVVDVGAAQSVAAVGGARFLAVRAQGPKAAAQRHLHVDEGAALGLVHFCGPQGAVQVHPQVHVDVQQAGRPVRGAVALVVAETAFALVPGQPVWTKGNAQAFHELRHLTTTLFLRTSLAYGDDNLKTLPTNPLPLLHFGMHHLLVRGERPALLQAGLRGGLHGVW